MAGKRREEIKQKTVLECLPSEAQYARLYWIYHLKGSKRKVRDGDEVHQFLERYLLQWLEALSLIGRISESIEFDRRVAEPNGSSNSGQNLKLSS